jgi:hypothetical protein
MIFQERKTETGYTYTVEDVFGTIEITSARQKITSELLDSIVSGILQANTTVGAITPEVAFVWGRPPAWLPEDKIPEPLKPNQCEKCRSMNTVENSLRWFGVGFVCLLMSFVLAIFSVPLFLFAAVVSMAVMCIGPMACEKYHRCTDCTHITRGRNITSKDSFE